MTSNNEDSSIDDEIWDDEFRWNQDLLLSVCICEKFSANIFGQSDIGLCRERIAVSLLNQSQIIKYLIDKN